ncbi:MAG: glutathione S-transferase [Acidobacteria bacterium]|nr:MAG: glutathione S-transferase [Acidobacteriota bacterium]GIK77318.1 MAG: glutathione S-transferase [Actinomycetes bacterium]
MIVYGSEYSYFTGKLEGYLRYKEIGYERRPLGVWMYSWKLRRLLGGAQLPTVRLDDGRWMTDTTPMIAWLEARCPDPPVIPAAEPIRLAALLVEDFGDEWLWRPAMHYRWSHAADRDLLSRRLAAEVVRLPLPLALRGRWFARRQARLFVAGDGVDARTRPHVEAAYTRVLDILEPPLARRPFLLGERPTIADFGMFGSMFRHFSLDPTPAAIMRERAPAVHGWVARVWAARASRVRAAPLLDAFPADLEPLLAEAGRTHLPMLAANASAFAAGRPVHDFTAGGVTYRGVPTSRYRVWALARVRDALLDLAGDDRAAAEELLGRTDCLAPLLAVDPPPSGHDPEGRAPFSRVARMVRDG